MQLPNMAMNCSRIAALSASVSGSIAELRGQRAHARRLGAIAVAGGICGALLLLATPSGAFVRIVLGACLQAPRQLHGQANCFCHYWPAVVILDCGPNFGFRDVNEFMTRGWHVVIVVFVHGFLAPKKERSPEEDSW